MKTFKKLYPRIYSFENLYRSFPAARKGKRDRMAVAGFELDLEQNLLALSDELRFLRYEPGSYTNFTIFEPKRRLISAAPFRDRVVHHALCNVDAGLVPRENMPDLFPVVRRTGSRSNVNQR